MSAPSLHIHGVPLDFNNIKTTKGWPLTAS
jgi:hypothetical protein